MAKSKLIRDLISDDLSLVQAFDRLLVIAMELNDRNLIKWAKQEKYGYGKDDEVPDYRYIKLVPIGDYRHYSMGYITTYSNQVLPTIGFTPEMKEKIENFKNRDSIAQIIDAKKALDNGKLVGIVEKPEFFSLFEEGTNIKVIRATLALNPLELGKILESTKTRLIEVLTLLEKNFGNLDEVDIDTRDYSDNEISALKKAVEQVLKGQPICTTYYITGSKIKNSNIGKDNKTEKAISANISPTVNVNQEKKSFFASLFEKLFKRSN